MFNTLRFAFGTISLPLRHDFLKLPSVASVLTSRNLYAKNTLGLDTFSEQKQQIKKQMGNIAGKFRERMTTYADENAKNMIFTEDLKNMVHLAESDSDFELVIKMAKKFNGQNKQLRFGSFVFGPVIMRMFYLYNRPDLALECFTSADLDGLFDQLITYQLLLDLLYENERYEDILGVWAKIVDKQIQGAKYPKNCVVLVMAACHKLNSKESTKFALQLWNDLAEVGHFPMRRATTFCAGLALNQGRPDVALEIVSSVSKPNYFTIRNIKAKALSEMGRVEDALGILRSVLSEDQPGEFVQTFNRDVVESIRAAVEKLGNPEISLEFERIEKLYEREGHISEKTLDEHLCSEIQRPPVMNSRQINRSGRFRPEQSGRSVPPGRRFQRPGLNEIV